MMIGRVQTMKGEVTTRRIVEEGVQRGYGGVMEEVPGKGEGGGGIVEPCVDYDCKESCEQGNDGEHNERERSKRKVVISGFGTELGAEKSYLRRK